MPSLTSVTPGAEFILQQDFSVLETGEIKFHFLAPNPGPGENSDWYVSMTKAEYDAAAVSTALLRGELQKRLDMQIRGTGINDKASFIALVGVRFTVA